MAWNPIADIIPQYQKSNGDLASGYYLKFFDFNTTTPINMATDSTGGTLLAKCQINSSGYPINGSSTPFIPYIDRKYKLSFFPTSTDADNNTNAIWTIDGFLPINSNVSSDIFYAENYSTFATAVSTASGKTLVISTAITATTDISLSDITIIGLHSGSLTLSTNANITVDSTVRFKISASNFFDISAAGATIVFDSPEQIEASPRLKIFTVSAYADVSFTNSGRLHAGWLGFSTSESRANNTTYFQYACYIAAAMKGLVKMTGGVFPMNSCQISMADDADSFGLVGTYARWNERVANTAGTVLEFTGLTGAEWGIIIECTENPGVEFGRGLLLENFAMRGPASQYTALPTNTTIGLRINSIARSRYHNVNIQNFYEGLSLNGAFLTTIEDCSASGCYHGLYAEGGNAQVKLKHWNGEVCFSGISIASGSCWTIDTPQLESCMGAGIYINPKSSATIRDIEIINPYFEGNTATVVTGANPSSKFWAMSGTIKSIRWHGGFFDSSTMPNIQNVTDLYLNLDEQYIKNFTIDANTSWTMNPGNASSRRNIEPAAGVTTHDPILFTEFQVHCDNTANNGAATVAMPDIDLCPIGIPYNIYRVDSTSNYIRLKGHGTQTINGMTQFDFHGKGAYAQLLKDTSGTAEWKIVSGAIYGETTWDPGSIADGDISTPLDVTVTGSQMGDTVLASLSVDIQDLGISASVTVDGTVTVILLNNTGGAVDLGACIVQIRCFKNN